MGSSETGFSRCRFKFGETVAVSWDERTAVSAPVTLVAEYWSDFFYAAAIVPLSSAWMLVWDHNQHFSFGIASHKPDEAI